MADTETLSLSRELFVPRELVFDTWTQPEHLCQWYSPGPDFQRSAEIDPTVGGSYVFTWQAPDSPQHAQSGEFQIVQAPERLVCSARLKVGGQISRSTRIDVQFADLSGGTRIDIVEAGYADARDRDEGGRSWELRLDQLEAYFSVI